MGLKLARLDDISVQKAPYLSKYETSSIDDDSNLFRLRWIVKLL
jgi:hypothetical protein